MNGLVAGMLVAGNIVLLCAGGCDRAPDTPLLVSELEIHAPRPGSGMGAAYLTLVNNLDEPVTITRVTSPQFTSVELHESVAEGDVASMRALPKLAIDAGETVRLVPGGMHLMLMRPVGGDGPTTLNFWSGQTLLVSVSADSGGA